MYGRTSSSRSVCRPVCALVSRSPTSVCLCARQVDVGGGAREEEDDEEEEEEEAGEDMLEFWKSVQYKVILNGTETAALALTDLQRMIQGGAIQDETTPMQVQGPDGEWEAWSTMGAVIADYDGFEHALFTEVETAETSVQDDPGEDEADADEEDPVAFWAQQSYEYKGPDGSTRPGSVCIGELQELLAVGSITPQTRIFCDEFDKFETISTARASNPTLAAALDRSYWSTMQYATGEGQLGAPVAIVKVRQLVREEKIDDETLVLGGDMAQPQPLGRVRTKFGLAAYMEPLDGDGGVDETELEREASEETKAKLAESVKATGKSGGFFSKFKFKWGSEDPKEKARKEAEKKKKKEKEKARKEAEKQKKAAKAAKQAAQVVKFPPDRLLASPAKKIAPHAVCEGQLQVFGGFPKKFRNRYLILVECDVNGHVLDLGAAACKPGFRRCVAIYDDVKGKKPSIIAESTPDGKFKLTAPKLDAKLKKANPHTFALHAIDPAALFVADDIHVIAASSAKEKGRWATVLTEGLKSVDTSKKAARVLEKGTYLVMQGGKPFLLKLEKQKIVVVEDASGKLASEFEYVQLERFEPDGAQNSICLHTNDGGRVVSYDTPDSQAIADGIAAAKKKLEKLKRKEKEEQEKRIKEAARIEAKRKEFEEEKKRKADAEAAEAAAAAAAAAAAKKEAHEKAAAARKKAAEEKAAAEAKALSAQRRRRFRVLTTVVMAGRATPADNIELEKLSELVDPDELDQEDDDEPTEAAQESQVDDHQQETIDYFCSLSFVYEKDDGSPSDETTLLDLKQRHAAGELASDTLIWTEDFDDWMALETVLKDVWADHKVVAPEPEPDQPVDAHMASRIAELTDLISRGRGTDADNIELEKLLAIADASPDQATIPEGVPGDGTATPARNTQVVRTVAADAETAKLQARHEQLTALIMAGKGTNADNIELEKLQLALDSVEVSSTAVGLSSLKSPSAKDEVQETTGKAFKDYTFDQILQMVQRPLSSFNWLLAEPNPEEPTIFAAGGGSLPELNDFLDDGKVLYGYVRLAFGTGQFRRTKWMFLRWSGEATPVMKRAQGNDVEGAMKLLLEPHALSVNATSKDDTATQAVINLIQKVIVSDNTDADEYSVNSFKAGLDWEHQQVAGLSIEEVNKIFEVPPEEKEDEADESESDDDDSDDDSDDDDRPYFMQHARAREGDLIGEHAENQKLIVDLGYGSTKFGLAGESSPASIKNIVYGKNPETGKKDYGPVIERKKMESMATDWEAIEKLWERMFEEELGISADTSYVSSTISPFGPRSYPEEMAELLFETFDVQGCYFAVPSILSLYSTGKTTGVVLDSGECITSCIPVIDGFVVQAAVQTLPFGGRDITSYITRQLRASTGYALDTTADVEVVRQMKEKLCYCGQPKDEAVQTTSFTLPDGKTLTHDAENALGFPQRIAEKFFFDPLKLDWDDTSMEESVHAKLFEAVMGALHCCPAPAKPQLSQPESSVATGITRA